MIITEIKARKKLTQLKRVAAYARVSADKETMLHSLAVQVEYYSRLIHSNPEWVNMGVYADEGLTGTKVNRPEFQRLIADCHAGKIDMVITKSISRFARNTVDLLNTIRELKAINVDVYFEEQNIHSLSGEGEFMLTILASYAQEESRSVSENCRWRYQKAFARGEVMNIDKLYGYKKGPDGWEIDEKEAEVVRWIFATYINGMGIVPITRELNKKGIPSKTGGRWGKTTVNMMLRNEKYTGNSLLQKTYIPDHLTKKRYINRGQRKRYYAEDTHPAIISMETFEQAQARLKEAREMNGIVVEKAPEKHALQKMIVCRKCGCYYIRKKSKYEAAWACTTYLHEGRAVCQCKKIPEDILEEKIADVLGIPAFDERIMRERIKEIRPYDGNLLKFIMKDGNVIQRSWKDKSRADSWTAEMRAVARARNEGRKK